MRFSTAVESVAWFGLIALILMAAWFGGWGPRPPRPIQPPSLTSDQLLHSVAVLQKRAEEAEAISKGLRDSFNRQADSLRDLVRLVNESESRQKEIEFYREQVTHLQAAVVNQAALAHARVGALADIKAENLVGAQHLRRPTPPAEDGFRSSPPDGSPIDSIRIPEEVERPARKGEAKISRPEPASLQGSQYDEQELPPPA